MKQAESPLKTVYDADGAAHLLESVDAREYIATGRYFSEPPVKEEAPAVAPAPAAQPAKSKA